MASPTHFDEDFDFGGGFSGTHSDTIGNKRPSPDYDDEDYDNDPFGKKKAKTKAEEAASGVTTGMILSLRESLQNCKDTLATCKNELEAAKSEIQKWHSSFQNEPFIPAETIPAPKLVINYLQALKSSEESLREQLEKAKKKEAAFIVTFAKREQEIAELKNLVEEKDKRVKELQDNIAAVNFTPQSKMGKMLMAKCRTLQEENEEIGNQASEGKEEFEARMSQVMSQTSSCSPSQSPEDPSAPLRVWADDVGGKKKGCLHGAGDLASNYKKGSCRLHIGESSSSGAAIGGSAADEQELAELKRAVTEQQRIAVEQQEEARRTNAILAQVLERQEQMYQLLARQQPPPPPPPPPPSTGDHVDDTDDVEHLDHDQDYQDY